MDNWPDCREFEKRYENVEVCRDCGLGRTTSALTPDDAQDYITSTTSHPDPVERRRYFQRLYRKYLRQTPRGRSLDVGCGPGQFVEVLLDAGWDAFGLDAYREARVNHRFIRGTMKSLEAGAAYDLISMVHTLEHIVNPAEALRRVSTMLRPGGIFLVVVPNFAGDWSVSCGDKWPMLDTRNHAFHYTSTALRKLLENGDFVVRKSDTYSGYAASMRERRFGENGFYQKGWGSVQPFRSLVFRANAALRPILNGYLDMTKRGAEIIMLATRISP